MGGGGLMPLSFTLMRQDVQDELKLTSDQKDKLDALRTESMNKMRGMFTPGQQPTDETRKAMEKMREEGEAKAKAILTDDQNKRLQEIRIQMAGSNAVFDKDVAKAIGITTDQDTKLKTLQQQMQDANRQVFEKAQNGEIERSQIRDIMTKNRETLKTQIDKVLTDAQKAKLKEMGGATFEQKDEPGRGFGGFGGGR